MTPTDEYLPSIFGTRTSLRPLDSAASTAARASSVSSVSVNTMFGRITPDVSDTSGSVTVGAWSPSDPAPAVLAVLAPSALKLSVLCTPSAICDLPQWRPRCPAQPSAWTVSCVSGESDLELPSTGPPICSWPFKHLQIDHPNAPRSRCDSLYVQQS